MRRLNRYKLTWSSFYSYSSPEMLICQRHCQGIVHRTGLPCKCKATMMVASDGPFLCGRHFKTFMKPIKARPPQKRHRAKKHAESPQTPSTCSICLDDIEMLQPETQADVKSLACGHKFHKECIDRWLAGHTTCPVCRQSIPPPTCTIFFYRRLFAP